MKPKDIHIAVSPLTGTIYAGEIKQDKDGRIIWKWKVHVTEQCYAACREADLWAQSNEEKVRK